MLRQRVVFKVSVGWMLMMFTLSLVALATTAGETKTIHVATTGDDATGDGSEGRPYATIQKGIDEAADSGDTVQVAAGTYRENLRWEYKSLILQGAGAGSSIVDGDVDGNGTGDGICLNIYAGRGEIHGFTFQHGYGSGIEAQKSLLLLTDNIIADNIENYSGGGGLRADACQVTLIHNTITRNQAHSGAGLFGGGCAMTLIDNTITANSSANQSSGGVYLASGHFTLIGNTIAGNTTPQYGGGVFATGSWGWTSLAMTGNTITGNTAGRGGGVALNRVSSTLTGNIITANTSTGEGGGVSIENGESDLEDNTLTDNISAKEGGGVWMKDSWGSFTNNLIARNQASSGGGLYLTTTSLWSEVVLTNNTVADNGAEGVLGEEGWDNTLQITLTNGILWGNGGRGDLVGATATYSDIGTGETTGEGNFSEDPLFVGGGDYHLQGTSPCLNCGSNAAPALPETDIDGEARIFDGTVDLGADEVRTRLQPDLCLRQGGVWRGDNVYNDDGTDQTGIRAVSAGTAAVYQVRLYNDGSETETFWIKGPWGNPNWTVRYYRGTTVDPGREVTLAVTSAQGWKRPNIPVGGYLPFVIAVTPNSGLSAGRYEALVRAESQRDPAQRDTIKAATRVK